MKNFMRLRKTAKNKAFAKTFSCEVELLKEQLDIVNKKKKMIVSNILAETVCQHNVLKNMKSKRLILFIVIRGHLNVYVSVKGLIWA